jgi:TPR repeat protein
MVYICGNCSSTNKVLGKANNNDFLSLSEAGDYYHGMGYFTEAFSWYFKAAKQGDGYSQNRMGEMLQEGSGVEQDNTSAMAWYVQAHFNGILQATNSIGLLYSEGLGVEQDNSMALRWHLVAANEGYDNAQYNVGIRYENGLGVKVSKKLALVWYEKAASQGHFGAKYAAKRLNNEGYSLSKRQKCKYMLLYISSEREMGCLFFKKKNTYSTLIEIHNEQLMKENKGGIAEKIKSTEQQLKDTETEIKHIDLKLKSLAEEINVLKQGHDENLKRQLQSILSKNHVLSSCSPQEQLLLIVIKGLQNWIQITSKKSFLWPSLLPMIRMYFQT